MLMQYMRTFRIISFSKDPTGTPVLEESKKITPTFRTSQSVSSVTQLCLTLCDPMDCHLPGSSVHGIFPGDIPWTARRSNQSILKEISPGISLEGMMLKLKLQYFGHLMRRADSLEKTLMLAGIGGRRRRG